MRSRVFLKLFGSFALVIAATTATLDFVIRTAWESSLRNQTQQSLTEKAELVANRFRERPPESLREATNEEARASGARVTLIDSSGNVLADSEADAAHMENHASRPEVAAALAGRVGSSTRWSHTRGIDFLYVSVPVPWGAVRVAYPLAAIQQNIAQVRRGLLVASGLALGVALLLAALLAHLTARRLQRIVAFAGQVAAGNFSARIQERSSDEIAQVAAALDATAQKLQRSFTEIDRLETTRRDFVANVSHELRTPLTSIQGYAETLLEAGDAPANREFLEAIRRNAARMSRLTEDLLILAQVESKEHLFTRMTLPVAGLLRDAEQSFHELARAKGVEIVLLEVAPRAVTGDPEALHQVFANLIDNALKYAAEGGRIELAARETDAGIEFRVRDFGPGIASEHLPRLFERFYRVDKARSVEAGGTGLGLAIAKHIVLAHGGAVRAESAPGQGATFFFTLPLASAA